MKVAGAPVGDDDYCVDFVADKVDAMETKLRALRGINPQVGMLLLRKCTMPALLYLAQVVPPSLSSEPFARFDDMVADCVADMLTLGPGARGPPCPPDRLAVFRHRLRLPMCYNGAGLAGPGPIAAAAFVGSVSASVGADQTLAAHVHGLERFAMPAMRMLRARLAALGDTNVNTILRLPLEAPLDLFDRSRYVKPTSEEKPKASTLQWEWSTEIYRAAAKELRPLERALGDQDLVASQARAWPVSLMLELPLSNPFFRFAPRDFICWFRFQFRIPQLPHLGNANPEGVEQCVALCASPCSDIDLHGNHANSGKCFATSAGRGTRHKLMKQAIYHHATKAGCLTSFVTEQTAAKLLLDEFTPQQCRTMFPRYITVDMAERSRILEAAFKSARDLPPSQKEAELRRLNVELQQLLNDVKDGHSLSMDGMIEHEASGEVVWYDASAIHTTAHSSFDAELSLTRRRMAAGKEGAKVQSEALLVAHNEKRTRYSLLNAIVERQVAEGMRRAAPLFLPVVATTHGELCPGAIRLTEWLVHKYRARLLLEGDRDDGETVEDLTAAFRREFRQSLTVAVARGHAEMLRSAGLPYSSKQNAASRRRERRREQQSATRTLDSDDAESHTLQVLTGPDFTVTEDHIPVDETDRDAELVMLDSCNDLAVAVAVSGLDT